MICKIRNVKQKNNEGQHAVNKEKGTEVRPPCTKYQIEVITTEDEAIGTFCQDIISVATFEVALEERLKLEPVDHVEMTRHEIDQLGRTHGIEDIALQKKENLDYSKKDKKKLKEIKKTNDKENKKLQKFQEKTTKEYIKMVNEKYKERNKLKLREWEKQVKDNKKKEKEEVTLAKKDLEREKKEMKLKEKYTKKEKKNSEKEEKKTISSENSTKGCNTKEENGKHKSRIGFFDRLRSLFTVCRASDGRAD